MTANALSVDLYFFKGLLVEFPSGSILRVLYFETETCKFVANTVARSPIFCSLGFLASFKQQINCRTERFFPAFV